MPSDGPWKPRTAAWALAPRWRILAETLVGAAPPVVPWYAHARCEGPVDAGTQHLLAGHVLDLLHQGRVAAGAEADVVREEDGALDVGVPVYGVDAVDEWDAQPALQRVTLEVCGLSKRGITGPGADFPSSSREPCPQPKADRRLDAHWGPCGWGVLVRAVAKPDRTWRQQA